jgi:hypothetical membrane protein
MPPPPPESNPQQRITHCAVCQYELTDQPTTYIPDYHLIATRCPECGQQQPAGITTQPWRYRKLKYALMLTLWALLVFISILFVTTSFSSIAVSTSYKALEPFMHHISEMQAQSDPKYHHSLTFDRPLNTKLEISAQWWSDVGRQQAKDNFNPNDHINWHALAHWLWFILIAPATALLFYAVISRSTLTTKIVIALLSLFLTAYTISTITIDNYTFYRFTPEAAAITTAGDPFTWSTLALGLLTTLIAYALTPKLLKVFNKHFRNLPKEPATS